MSPKVRLSQSYACCESYETSVNSTPVWSVNEAPYSQCLYEAKPSSGCGQLICLFFLVI